MTRDEVMAHIVATSLTKGEVLFVDLTPRKSPWIAELPIWRAHNSVRNFNGIPLYVVDSVDGPELRIGFRDIDYSSGLLEIV